MPFLLNDLSFHGQFFDLETFKGAILVLMKIRAIAKRFGHEVYCHRNILNAQVMRDTVMPKAVQCLSESERRALTSWLTQQGPFWEDERQHRANDYLEYKGGVVTDTAIGEAAWCLLNGIERGIVSISPSAWEFSPIAVDWISGESERRKVDVVNFWEASVVEDALHLAPAVLISWEQLAAAQGRYTALYFADDAFAPLKDYPFFPGAAQRVLCILDKLNRLRMCFDEKGQRTPAGHEIYMNFFTGKKNGGGRGALFKNSSDDEKNRFKAELTFKHPEDSSKTIFCPWHGSVQTPQLRVHFSYPICANAPLYVVYVGPKITRR